MVRPITIERLRHMAPAETPKTETTSRKGVQVHATLAPEFFEKLEDHRWTVRLNMVDLVKLALTEYAERNGLLTPSAPEAPKASPKA